MKFFFCAIFAAAATLQASPTWISVVPSATDPAIRSFNTPHWACVDGQRVMDRHELLLFIPGTFGHGRGAKGFQETAASLGYHTIELMYPDDVSAAEACWNDRDPQAFENFRMALLIGGKSAHLSVKREDSIESRLTKLLSYLQAHRPREDWGQFLHGDAIAWERIAVSGQSQGGGHAGLLAVKHRVARVIMFGAPKDFSRALHGPAAWYSEEKATPVAAFFAINHRQDRQGCDFAQELQNVRALGLNQLGPPVLVDGKAPPYNHSRILFTNYPGKPVESKVAHGTAISDRNAAVFRPTWIYLLTEPIGPGYVNDQPPLAAH